MRKLLNLFNDSLLDEKTERIIEGRAEVGLFEQKAKEFSLQGEAEQVLFMAKLNDRIKQVTSPHKLLAIVHLVGHLMSAVPQIGLPHMEFASLQAKQTKESVALTSILRYYQYFLQLNDRSKYNVETINAEEELSEAEQYCELVVQKMSEFFKIEFIFHHALLHFPKHRLLLRLTTQAILQRFSEDLRILTTFVNNNYHFILQVTVAHPLLFHINYLYERLLFINRSLAKLERCNKLSQANVFFPTFAVEKELNRQIELQMLGRQEEQRVFTQRLSSKVREQRSDEVDKPQFICTTESFLLFDDEVDIE